MLVRIITVLLLAASFLPMEATAQLPDYHVRIISEQQGLYPAEVIGMAKDQRGAIWLISQTAAQRYDGRSCQSFPINQTARQVFIDSRDNKWVLTRAAIFRFENDYIGFTQVPLQATENSAAVCLFEVDNNLFLVMSDGIQQYDTTTGGFKPSTRFPIKFVTPLSSLFAFNQSHIFLTSGNRVISINRHNGDSTSRQVSFSMSTLVALGHHQLLASDFNSRTFQINMNDGSIREWKASLVTQNSNATFFRLNEGIEMAPDIFLISSNLGLVQYNQREEYFKLPVFYQRGQLMINNQSVSSFFRDKDGSIYMSHADGMAFFNPHDMPIHYLRTYSNNNEKMPDIDVRSFAEDGRGNIWLATSNGLARINMGNGLITSYTPDKKGGINYPSIRHLHYEDNKLWIATGGKGIWIYNTIQDRFYRPVFSPDSLGQRTERLLNNDYMWKMLDLPDGDILAIAGRRVYRLNKTTLQTSMVDAPLAGISRSALLDSFGRIWIGGTNGLACSAMDHRLHFTIRDSFPDKRIADILEWKKGHYLIASRGLFEVHADGRGILSFHKVDSFPGNRFIFSMTKDAAGSVWMGTDAGLYRYDPINHKIELFDLADNVQAQAYNSNGLFYANNGLLFAGGKAGFNFFNPATVEKKENSLVPFVGALRIGYDDSSFFLQPQALQVAYYNPGISLTISAPSFVRPYAIHFRYRMGKDKEWLYNGNNDRVLLYNLPAGRYAIDVAASFDGRNWFTGKETIYLVVEKPWWQQWWFRVAAILLLLTAVYVTLQYRKRQKLRKNCQQAVDYFANSGYEHANTEEILWDIARNCIARLGLEDCVIYLVDTERNILQQKAAFGSKNPGKNEILNPLEIPVGTAIVGAVAASGNTEIVNDTSKDKRYLPDDRVRLSEISVPIIHQDQVIGVIDSEHRQRNFFNDLHLRTLQQIAAICSSKISRSLAVAEMKKAEEQLRALHTKITETKFLNLRLQMNPHFLFNSLNSIQHLIVAQQTNEAYRYLSVFSNFLRSVLQYADVSVIKLEEEMRMLEMYISLERLGSDKTFEYNIVIDEMLDKDDVLIPPLMIQPLVENAIWHGLMPKEGPRQLSIQFKDSGEDHLICVVEDNGVGRKAAAEIGRQQLTKMGYQSKSTGIIRERLQILQEQTGKQAEIRIVDKKSNGQTDGTRVTLIIPLYNLDEL